MKHNLIFGHKVPDTDSVCSAIALASLKNKLNIPSKPYVLGKLNNETKFVLKYFGIEEPQYLSDVKLQVKDLSFDKISPVTGDVSIHYAYEYMNLNKLRTLPVVDENKRLIGIITMKDIAMSLINTHDSSLEATYDNILETLDAKEIVRIDEHIIGDITVAAFYEETLKKKIAYNNQSIVIVGDRYDVIEYAIENNVKLIIVTGNLEVPLKLVEKATKNKVNIISSPLKSYGTTKNICFSKSIKSIMIKNEISMFCEDDFVTDCKDEIENSRHSKFPVVTKDNKYLGILSRRHLLNPERKNVILVDHNEMSQSVDGLKEANIIEVVDHHKIGDINTSAPINFRNMIVGSSNTIVYQLYKENNIAIDKNIAGIMLSAIISDTLLFKSPTTTELDKITVNELAIIAGVDDIYSYAMEMFKAGTSLKGKTIEEIFYQDYKEFVSDEIKIGVAQVFSMSIEEILSNKDEYVQLINKITEDKGFMLNLMAVTDIINEGSYIFYTSSKEKLIKQVFNLDEVYQGVYIPGCVSRKKQIMPYIMQAVQR